jgi:small-conductance mechanosensitive channel
VAGGIDFYGLTLAVGVLALFGWFFWHVGATMIDTGRRLAAYLDGSSARRRAALEQKAVHGPTPLWLKAIRFFLIASLIVLLASGFWIKMTAA